MPVALRWMGHSRDDDQDAGAGAPPKWPSAPGRTGTLRRLWFLWRLGEDSTISREQLFHQARPSVMREGERWPAIERPRGTFLC